VYSNLISENDNVLFVNIDEKNYLSLEPIINIISVKLKKNINISGVLNYYQETEFLKINNSEVQVFKNYNELMEFAEPEKYPNKIMFFSVQEDFDVKEICNIISRSLIKIDIFLIIKNIRFSLTEKYKEVIERCNLAGCRLIITPSSNLGYEVGYLIGEPDDMPWVYNYLDPDLEEALNRFCISRGTFLDLGTGCGNQAIELSKRGFTVTGTDIVSHAFISAKTNGYAVDFIQDDILNSKLQKKFDFIFDRGCFHSIAPSEWTKYLYQIKKLLNDDGILFLKVFSKDNSYRDIFSPEFFSFIDIRNIFENFFDIKIIKKTFYQESWTKNYPKALFVIMRKK
jgi:2-polyprenyl-3-methyl-5-hydroxy-6-metoxy-1,4-benzoquinol methylase